MGDKQKTSLDSDPQAEQPLQSKEAGREADLESLQTEVAQLRLDVANFKGRWQRAVADMENYRHRVARETARDRLREKARLMKGLIELLDVFDKALEVDYERVEQAREGMVKILTQLAGFVKKEGLEPVPSVGEPFSPASHEALTTIEHEKFKPDTIVEEVVRGYTLDGELLRPARVVVAKAPAAEDDEQPAGPTKAEANSNLEYEGE